MHHERLVAIQVQAVGQQILVGAHTPLAKVTKGVTKRQFV